MTVFVPCTHGEHPVTCPTCIRNSALDEAAKAIEGYTVHRDWQEDWPKAPALLAARIRGLKS